jgi:hypothetical protein
MALNENDIVDLVTSTRKHFLKQTKFETIFNYESYEFMDSMFRKERHKVDSGTAIEFGIQLGSVQASKFTSLYERDNYEIGRTLNIGSVPWRHVTANWTFEVRELLMNSGNPEKLMDLLKSRRLAAMKDLADTIEAAAWSAPASSADTTTPWGLPYWVVKGADASAGFIGGNPSGFSDCGGISATTEANWRNYSARGAGHYGASIDDTLINAMAKAWRKLKFKAPVVVQDLANSPRLQDFRIYCNGDTIDAMGAFARTRNDGLGPDLAQFNGAVSFKKQPFIWVAALDSDAQDPFYLIDKDTFGVYSLKGDHMRESNPRMAPNQHNARVVDVDSTFNLVCRNRRKQGVICKA